MTNITIQKQNYILGMNDKGKTVSSSSRGFIEKDGYLFRNLDGSSELKPYEDWRLSDEERAEDLVNRLSLEERIGLMLHSSHQNLPAIKGTMLHPGTYKGKEYDGSEADAGDLTDQQQIFLKDEKLRHVLVSGYKDLETMVKWSNNLQASAEKLPFGIPVNISSDPRHSVVDGQIEFKTDGKGVSVWPDGMAMAATFSETHCKNYAEAVAKEYRAMGIATLLGPQIDLATDPRWSRANDTFGADSGLSTKLAKAFCDGLQTTTSSESGWGSDSVIAMAKHWPGGGTGEGGRDAHYPFGKYAIFPGNNINEHLTPFLEGAFKLPGKTKSCAAVMPYYTISWEQDKKNEENVGNAYSEYLIKDLLLDKYQYEGVVCTDWGITQNMTPKVGMFIMGGKCHGVEGLSEEERFLKLIMNGVNQFGDVDTQVNIQKAYALGIEKYGKEVLDWKIRVSAYKLLLNMFRVNLFDNPYLDLSESQKIVGCLSHRNSGYNAQLESVVLLKDKEILPLQKIKVYSPNQYRKERYNFLRFTDAEMTKTPVSDELLGQYFEVVDTPQEAEAALVFIDSPIGTGGYDPNDLEKGGNGYLPISLQYRPYKANLARKESIAGGDPREKNKNRSYYGKTEYSANESDLDNVIEMRTIMGEKPVIVVVRMKNAAVLAELEPYADVILADFGVQKQALLDILTGKAQSKGRLPISLPKNMDTIETHNEDVATDIEPYTDSTGNIYHFGFGIVTEQKETY